MQTLVYYTPTDSCDYKAIGATENEITNLEEELDITFPLAYRKFLRNFGVSGDSKLEELPGMRSNMTGPIYDIYTIRKLNLYIRNNELEIPLHKNDFVFMAYRIKGYQIISLNVFDVENPTLNCRQLYINDISDWESSDLEMNIEEFINSQYSYIS